MNELVMYPGSKAVWQVVGRGTSKGRILSDGYQEPDWNWVALKRADGTYPDFIDRVSASSVTQVKADKHV